MIRPRSLSAGWYPRTAREIAEMFAKWKGDAEYSAGHPFQSVIVPHAGWLFSGKLAFQLISALRKEVETVVIVGGHLGVGDSVIAAPEEGYETPLGEITADLPLLDRLRSELPIGEDTTPDNTVEVQLPIVKYFYPHAKALYLRVPPADAALALGELLAARSRDRNGVVVIGSTDLTHYGPNYGFLPHGTGEDARRWVREVNDKTFIDACLQFDARAALRHALANRAACSPGAACTAIRFAQPLGAGQSILVDYATSYDVHPDSSFVGYAGIGFYP